MTMGSSQEFVAESLQAADECLQDATLLLEHIRLKASVSRAYYAVYHAVQAVLAVHGHRARTHSGARMLFGRHIINPGILGKRYSKIYGDLYVLRHISDYDVSAQLGYEHAKEVVASAEEFVLAVKDIIQREEQR